MPELPEVETIKRDLEKALIGKTVAGVQINDPTVITGISPKGLPRRKISAGAFARGVQKKRVTHFHRKGKYLVMEFTGDSSLIFHLRMTGQLRLEKTDHKARAVFYFSDRRRLSFSDRRRFGEIRYSPNWRRDSDLNRLGVEPLNGELTADYLQKIFRGRSASVHSLLLNQELIAGIGNIYANEALFEAGLNPKRHAGRISLAELEKLVSAIRNVLKKSISNRGYSMSTYVDVLGRKGRSQLFTAVYGKAGCACPRCGKILKRAVIGGRGVSWCAQCQK